MVRFSLTIKRILFLDEELEFQAKECAAGFDLPRSTLSLH